MNSLPAIARRRFATILCCAAMTLALNGCAGFASFSEAMFMMSPDQELELGNQVAEQIESEMAPVTDPEINRYMIDLGQRLWANSPQGPLAPRFFVVKQEELNAFAIPGGNVYIHTGLIDAADDEAELASVVAHELGHVIMRHGARHVSHSMGLDLVQQVVLGSDAGQASQIVGSIIEQGIITNYSRQDESEADRIAVQTLHKAGYDPAALSTFFAKLRDKYGDSPGGVSSLFASHPPTAERMANVQAMVRQLPPRQYTRPVTELRKTQGRLKKLGM
jgi:predicted Zn-dependent protease